jgi:lincosamide nucleotidyltransferase A/C/D/E
MGPEDVCAVLSIMDAAGLTAWVDGGWGIDALVGRATRPHRDLDLVVRLPELPEVRSVLAAHGYRRVLRDWLPTALAIADGAGHEVDLHPLTPTGDGGGDQALSSGSTFHYPPPATGVIGDRIVSCVDAATQVRCHLGYEPSTTDFDDMRALHGATGIDLPPSYRATRR